MSHLPVLSLFPSRLSLRTIAVPLLLAGMWFQGCAPASTSGGTRETAAPQRRLQAQTSFGSTDLYRESGLITSPGPLSFVGGFHFLKGPGPDSTLVLLSLAMPATALTFVHRDNQYRGEYEVRIEFRDDTAGRRVESRERVLLPSFRETVRTSESIIYQRYARITPGTHRISIFVRDLEGLRSSTVDMELTVPRITGAALSSPVPVYEEGGRSRTDSLPRFVASPRGTATFGRDSALMVYVEAYGDGAAASVARVPIEVAVTDAHGAMLWSDTITVLPGAPVTGVSALLPVSSLAIGRATVRFTRLDSGYSSQAPIFVGFGEDLPLVSFEDMLEYLQYFATPERLRAIRNAPPEMRASEWQIFLRETDPAPTTQEHEGLLTYFDRIRMANERFRADGASGWRSDRGKVFVALGEPDLITEHNRGDITQRGQTQVWEYHEHRIRLWFVDQSGFGRWELTPNSETEFRSTLRRVQAG